MRKNTAIAVLMIVGLLAGAGALASAVQDVSLQYSGDSVSLHNSGNNTVTATVMRTCMTSPLSRIFPTPRALFVMADPGELVRIDRNRNGACSYTITAARYARTVEAAR